MQTVNGGASKAVKMASLSWIRQAMKKGSHYVNTKQKVMAGSDTWNSVSFILSKTLDEKEGTAGLGQHPVGLHALSTCLRITAAFPSVHGIFSHAKILIEP